MNDAAPEIMTPGAPGETPPPAEATAGQQLHEARERLGLSVADVARHLKLHPRQVEALERDAFADLPGPVFVRGFMRNYARLVGLDGEALVGLAERLGGLPAPVRGVAPAMTARAGEIPASLRTPLESRRGKKGWLPITVALIVAAAGIVYYHSRSVTPPSPPSPAPAGEAVAPAAAPAQEAAAPAVPTPAESPAPAPGAASADAGIPPPISGTPASAGVTAPKTPIVPPAAEASPAAAKPAESSKKTLPAEPKPTPAQTPTPAASEAKPASRPEARETRTTPAVAPLDPTTQRPAGGPEIRLSFSRESWVEVRDASGGVIFSQLNPAGTERVIRGQPPFQVTVGNAGGVSVRYNAREIDLGPSTRTDVAHITLE
ncbi:MAG: DUF4115 domain-containing protein [Burkholderiales bacterium]